jgi:hypothetical protein
MPFDAQLTLLGYVSRHYVSCDFGAWRLLQALVEHFRRERRISVKERVASAFKVFPKYGDASMQLITRSFSGRAVFQQRGMSSRHLFVAATKAEASPVSEPEAGVSTEPSVREQSSFASRLSTCASTASSSSSTVITTPASTAVILAPEAEASVKAAARASLPGYLRRTSCRRTSWSAEQVNEQPALQHTTRYRVSPAARARWDLLASIVLTDSVSKAQQRQRDQRIAHIIDELERLTVRAIDEINGWHHQKTHYSAAATKVRTKARAKWDMQKLSLGSSLLQHVPRSVREASRRPRRSVRRQKRAARDGATDGVPDSTADDEDGDPRV